MIKLADLFPFILVSTLSSFLVTPLFSRLCTRLGLVDVPGSAPHKKHQKTTPLGGGLVLFTGLAATLLILRPEVNSKTAGILIGGLVLVLVGLWDDRFGMSPVIKLIFQFAAAGIVMAFGLEVRLLTVRWANIALTLLWLVGLTNAFNFVDSMDSLALGLAGIGAAFFMLVTIDSQQPQLALLCAIIMGLTIGLYYYNAAPARIFLGDSGSQLLGLLLAAVGLSYNPLELEQGVSWFTPILVLGVPIFDTVLVCVTRLRERRPVYQAGRDHTYHRLVELGLDSTRSVLTMQVVGVGLGLISFMALGASVLVANIIFGAIVLGGVVAVVLLTLRGSAQAMSSSDA